MSEAIELNQDEISLLASIDDYHGHAWAMYIILKKNMNIYTGLVQVELGLLTSVFIQKLQIDAGSVANNSSNNSVDNYLDSSDQPDQSETNLLLEYQQYVKSILTRLSTCQIISEFDSCQDYDSIAIKLPHAISETCMEPDGRH